MSNYLVGIVSVTQVFLKMLIGILSFEKFKYLIMCFNPVVKSLILTKVLFKVVKVIRLPESIL